MSILFGLNGNNKKAVEEELDWTELAEEVTE